jgi:hypothetical protein
MDARAMGPEPRPEGNTNTYANIGENCGRLKPHPARVPPAGPNTGHVRSKGKKPHPARRELEIRHTPERQNGQLH